MADYETDPASFSGTQLINGRAMPGAKVTESLPRVFFTSLGWRKNDLCCGKSGP